MKKEKTKGGYIGQSVVSLIAAILIALLLFAAFSDDIKYLFGKAESMNDVLANGGPEKGQYVSVGVDAVFGCYGETTYKINGVIPAGSKQHYVIWLYDNSVISLTAKGKKNTDIINGVISDTEKYLYGETEYLASPVIFEGKITSIEPDGDKYYSSAVSDIRQLGIPDLEVRHLTIDTTYTKTSIVIYGIIFLAVIGMFIGLFIGGIKGAKRLKAAEALASSAAQNYNTQYDNGQSYNTYDNNQGGNA